MGMLEKLIETAITGAIVYGVAKHEEKSKEQKENFPPKDDTDSKGDNDENSSNENEDGSEDKSSNFMNKNYSQTLANIMPEVRKEFYGMVDKSSKILSKNPVEMTKEEMMKAKAFVYDNAYHPKKDALNQHLENYFKVRYPGEVEYDETGRMIDPQSIIPEPTVKAKYKDINGRLIDDGLDNILIKTALSSKSGNGAKNLQKAVNSLQGFNVLKEDNDDKFDLRYI
ncbi:MAG: hypothetical protein AB7U85_00425 [Alphaproteobacteria bacterium]